jgi:tetratricopeptide (TPR) repeat protein
MDKMGIVPPVQNLIFKKEYAHTLLRNNNVEEAYKILADVLKATSLHKSMCSFFVAIVYKSEADIRLNKFEEAYEDCKLALLASGDKSNYAKLITCQCFYNMAIAKYKMSDYRTALKHFEEFFKAAREFSKDFLDKNVFEQLKSQSIFEIAKDTFAINTYLQNSLKIFTAIYGADHPFVKDFVAKQCVADSVH